MKALTRDWLMAASLDLRAIEHLLSDECLTTIIAFHAQQAVEKSFKAVLEEHTNDVPRLHTLISLYKKVCACLQSLPSLNDEILRKLDLLYTDSRYPGNFGFLPDGPPTAQEAEEFVSFANTIYDFIKVQLELLPEV
jgi:HEPN domain-containing protein